MEWVGFRVDKMLLPMSAAVNIWRSDDPYAGTYHAAIAGWAIGALPRDQGERLYTADTKFVRSWPRWLNLDPPQQYLQVAERLFNRDYASLAEREELFEQALWMRMQVLATDPAG
jgi:hypothetical protein